MCRFPAFLIAWLLLFAGHASAQDRFQVLHEFSGQTDPSGTRSLLAAADGSVYGTTTNGGTYDGGTLFKLAADGTFSVLYSFERGPSGVNRPELRLQTTDGRIFVSNRSTLFRVVDDHLSVFASGVDPEKLIESQSGELYGVGNVDGHGESFFTIGTNGTVAVLHEFLYGSEGACVSTLLQASDGNFYGTSRCGAAEHDGTLFRLTPSGSATVLHVFDDHLAYASSLVEGPGGTLFGTGVNYPSLIRGVFRMAPDGSVTIVRLLDYGDAFLLSFDGAVFRGMTSGYFQGSSRGTFFSMTPSGETTWLAWFEGYLDQESVIQGHAGEFYASQRFVRSLDLDRVLRLDSSGASTVIHDFSVHGSAGSYPGALVEATDGNFYGTTAGGGSQNAGTLFRMTRWGRVDSLHEFGGVGGSFPGSLIQATDGQLYGLTSSGGAFGSGTIFRISLSGEFSTVYSFNAVVDGSYPSRLLQARDGLFYGVASSGGPGGGGTIFRLDASGSLTVIHSFRDWTKGDLAEGIPVALVQASAGTFFGTTFGTNAWPTGTIFKMLPDGTFTRLHTFNGHSDGGGPGALVEGQDGNFVGATSCPSTIFKISPAGEFSTLSAEGGDRCDDDYPTSWVRVALVGTPEGSVYGLRDRFPNYGSDDLFTMTSDGTMTVLQTFSDQTSPRSLMQARNGNLYGTTSYGGTSGSGTVFRYNLKPESLIYIDSPISAQVLVEPFVMSGWAFDATDADSSGVDAIHVWAYPNPGSGQAPVFAGVATIGRPRPDVGAYFGNQFASSGFELAVRGLAPGPYQFVVFTQHTMTGSFDDSRAVDVTIAPNAPMAIDSPVQGATVVGPVRLSGWAVDRAAVTGTGVSAVHVWVYPNPGSGQPPFFAGAATYGRARPDVGAIFGDQFTNSAYNLTVTGLAAGDYRLVVFAYSTVSQTFLNAQTVTVHAVASTAMAVDVPVDGATVSGPFTISGWAIDRAAATGPGVDAVHVWAYPNPGSGQPPFFAGAATYGGARPDVGAIFGNQFTNSAYNLTVTGLAAGDYRLVVFAYSTVSQSFSNAMTVTVHAVASTAMAVDVPVDGATVPGTFTISGWAIDRAAATGPGVDAVHVWAYPASGQAAIFLGAATYGGVRPDVGAVFGGQFTNSAFTLTAAALAPGRYQLVVFARSRVTGTFDNSRVINLNVH